MSYILEALKKAEADRHAAAAAAPPVPPSFARGEGFGASTAGRPWLWAVVPALAIPIAATAWLLMRDDEPRARPVVAMAPQAAPAATPAAPPKPVTPAPSSPAPAKKERAPEIREDAPQKSTKPKDKPAKKTEEKKPAKNHPPAAAPAAEPTAPAQRDLPAHIQQALPPLTIGGYIYSSNRLDRSVLINKRLLHEGDEVAPGLWLEKLTPTGMVLNFKGHRYRRSY